MAQASSSELISSAASLSGISSTVTLPSGYYPSQQVQQPLVHQFQVHQPIDVRQILPPPHQQQPSFPVHTLSQALVHHLL